jgi:hypothetical protein
MITVTGAPSRLLAPSKHLLDQVPKKYQDLLNPPSHSSHLNPKLKNRKKQLIEDSDKK